MELGKRIKYLRQQRGWTQEELATKLYVSRAAISKWETGKGTPNITSLQDLSTLFEVTINDLLSNEKFVDYKEKFIGFSVVDILIFCLMFLPLFGLKINDKYLSVSLFRHDISNVIIMIIYYLIFVCHFALALFEIFYLKFQWRKWVLTFSIIISIGSLFVFIITNEPYINFFILIGILMKVFISNILLFR